MNNALLDTIPACDKPCDLCGRVHRNLKRNGNLWLGARCMDNYNFVREHSRFGGTPAQVIAAYFDGITASRLRAAFGVA